MNEKPISYETPALVLVGSAQETIRGICCAGFDADTLFLASGQEFQSELDVKD